MTRPKQNDASVTEVGMWQGKGITVQPGQPHTLFTYGLRGCQATLLIAEPPDGPKTAILTHYPPTHLLENGNKLRQLMAQHPEINDPGTKYTLIQVVPGEYKKDPETGKYNSLDAKDSDIVDFLSITVKAQLGINNLEERVLPYSRMQYKGKSNAFIIDFPEDPGDPVHYTACGEHFGKISKD